MSSSKFIILTHGRAGSTYLQELLDSHSSIECREELFNASSKNNDSFYRFCKSRYPGLASLFLRERINNSEFNFPLRFLFRQYLKHISKTVKKERLGFRLVYDQFLYYRPLRAWVASASLPIIQLQRKNLLKSAISLLIARDTGKYVATSHQANVDRKIKIDPNRLLATVELLDRQRSQCEMLTSRNPTIKVYYEDLFANQNRIVSELIAFLGVSPSPLTLPDIVKTNPEKISDTLENYSEVKQALMGTRWEKFVD